MNQLNQQMKGIRAELGKQTVGDRVNDMAGAVFSSSAAGVSNFIGTAADTFGRASGIPGGPEDRMVAENQAAHYREMLKTGRMADGSPMTPETRHQMETLASRYEAQARAFARQEKSFDELHPTLSKVKTGTQRFADQAQADAARFTGQAKEGLGKVGQLAVDVGIAGGQMGLDALTAALTGGSSLVPMAVRAAGGAMQEARQAGASLDQQWKYGLGSAALSVGTEKIANIAGPFKKMFGAGAAEKIAGKLVSRFGENGAVKLMTDLSKTAGGRIALSALSEGGEEVVEDILQPFLKRATYDPDAKFNAAETGRDALIGAILGTLGAAPEGIGQASQNRAQRRAQAGAVVNESTGAGVDAALAQNAVQSIPRGKNGPLETLNEPEPGKQGGLGAAPGTEAVNTQARTPAQRTAEDAAAPAQSGGMDPLMTAMFGGGKRVDQSALSNEDFGRLAELSEQGIVGMDAGGRVYQVDPAQHIDQRDWSSVGDRKVNAFQYDHPELKGYLQDAARTLIQDLSATQRADSYFIDGTAPGSYGYDPVLHRTKRSASPEVAGLLDSGISYDRIGKALDAIMNNHGAENYADAKRVELVLDRMLTDGFHGVNGWIDEGPNAEYIREKRRIAGSDAGRYVEDGTGLGAADAGSINTSFDQMQAQSDAFHPVNPNAEERIAQGQRRAPSEVPTVNPATNRNVTKTVSTILNSPLTSPEMAVEIENAVSDGQFDYIPVTDRGAAEAAQKDLSNRGLQRVASEFLAKVDMGQRITKADSVAAINCYNRALSEGDHVLAFDLAVALSDVAHDGAQVTQSMNLLNRMTPEGKLLTLRKFVDKMNRKPSQTGGGGRNRRGAASPGDADLAKTNFVEEMTGIRLSEELATNYLMAETDAEAAAAWDAITTDLANQMPSTFMEKVNFFRYTSMLLNPTTHWRNILGNGVQAGARTIKNGIGAAIERAVIKDQTQRTKSILTGAEGKALKEFARKQYETADKDAAMGAGKYSDASARGIEKEILDKRKVFNGKDPLSRAVQATGDFNTRMMDTEDVWFNKPAYVDSFAQALKAKGVTAAEAAGGAKADLVEAARAYAIEEAQRATYRNTTALSETLSKMGRYNPNANKFEKGLKFVGDAFMPFRRTPANVLTTGLDYSPLGIAKAVNQAVMDLRQGKCTAADVVDSLSAGLTGSGIMALGAYLAAEGLLKVKLGNDDREEAYNKDRGAQKYALEIGGKSYTLDWASPSAMPLMAGAAIMDSVAGGGNGFEAVADAMGGISEVVLETSMLSTLNDLISNWSYAKNKATYVIDRAVSGYANQFAPTVLGKIASAADDTVRKSYVETGTGQVASDIDYFLQGVQKKVPGKRSDLQPKIDLWGEDTSNGSAGERIFQNFFSPGSLKTIDNSAIDAELRRLRDAVGTSAVYPSAVEKSFSVGGGETKQLTSEEYTKYARKVGQTRRQLVEVLMDSKGYKHLSDQEKASVIFAAYEYANAMGKMEVSNYKPAESSVAAGALKSPLPTADYILYRNVKDRDGSGTTNYMESAQTLMELSDLTNEQRGKAWEVFNPTVKQDKNPFTGALPKAGISPETSIKIMGEYRELSGDESMKPKERAEALKKYAYRLELAPEQIETVRETYKFGGGYSVTW